MSRTLLAALGVALLIPATAAAHGAIAPPFVNDGVESAITFETPNERPPHTTTALAVTAPPGISVVSASAPAGWQAMVSGSTVTWSTNRLENQASFSFPLRVTARVRAGTYSFKAEQRYDDGGVVRWAADLSVLPAVGAAAPKQHPWGAVAAALAGVVVIGASLVSLRHFRRKPPEAR